MPLRITSGFPGTRIIIGPSSSRAALSARWGEAAFSSTIPQNAEDDRSAPPPLDGLSLPAAAKHDIDTLSSSGIEESRIRSSARKETQRQIQRQENSDKHSADAGNDPMRRRPDAFFDVPDNIAADPFAEPAPPALHPPGQNSQPRKRLVDRVADDLFLTPPQNPHPAQQHRERGAPGPERQRQGGYDPRGSRGGSRPNNHRAGPPNQFSPNAGPLRGGAPGTGVRGGFKQGGPPRSFTGGSNRGGPFRGGGGGGRGGARGGRGGGRGRFGPRGVPGLGDMNEADAEAAWLESVIKLPAPQPPVNDQSFLGLFGQNSLVGTPIHGSRHPEHNWWAKGMDLSQARRSEVMRLAGSYDTMLPDTPVPSDPQLANNPRERAKATFLWTSALSPGVGLERAKANEEKVSQALQSNSR
ncbi:hypothetical protein BD324DRAFT_616696 [Kockovaella imperatae]|uniref:Uncharacterized protein n=1 Tax=Kockovaella imperatae TaxID=4999 RepID=A0A1Y1URW9_9TREE|nr:hypothetical protein BD324DRAFT_616696 [Kockovaella imperatae]ORX40186.1 hypothetical protein BD324DRAFT_616696 [Kockovaella imperatae]